MTNIQFRWLIIPFALTAMLLAAADFAVVLKGEAKKGPGAGARTLRALWFGESWLGGSLEFQQRQPLGEKLFAVGMLLFQFRTLMNRSMLRQIVLGGRVIPLQGVLASCYDLAVMLLLAKLLFCTRFSWRQMFRGCVLLGLLLLNQSASPSHLLFLGWLAVAACQNMPLRREVKILWVFIAGMVILHAALSLSGLIPMDSQMGAFTQEVGRTRYALGFTHPNSLGLYTMLLCAGWMLLRWSRMRWFDWAGMSVMAALCLKISNSRTSAGAILLMTLLSMLLHKKPRLTCWRGLPWLLGALPPVAAALSLTPCLFYRQDSAFWQAVNRVTSDRARLCWLAAQEYPVKLQGNHIEMTDTLYALDNAYVDLLLQRGAVCFALGLAALCWLLFIFARTGRTGEAVLLITMLCYSVMEALLFLPDVNWALWLLSPWLFGTGESGMSRLACPLGAAPPTKNKSCH